MSGSQSSYVEIDILGIPLPDSSKVLDISEVAAKYARNVPFRFRVVNGFMAENTKDPTIGVDEVYTLHLVRELKVVVVKHAGDDFEIPVNSTGKFGLVQDKIASSYETVGDVLSEKHLPAVVAVKTKYIDPGGGYSLRKNEILFIKDAVKGKFGRRTALRVFSISSCKEMTLQKDCNARFSTDPVDTQLYLTDLLDNATNLIPCAVTMFPSKNSPLDGLQSSVISIERQEVHRSVIISLFRDNPEAKRQKNITFIDVPTTMDICISIIKTENSNHIYKIYKQSEDFLTNYDPSTIHACVNASTDALYMTQAELLAEVRKERARKELVCSVPKQYQKFVPKPVCGHEDGYHPDVASPEKKSDTSMSQGRALYIDRRNAPDPPTVKKKINSRSLSTTTLTNRNTEGENEKGARVTGVLGQTATARKYTVPTTIATLADGSTEGEDSCMPITTQTLKPNILFPKPPLTAGNGTESKTSMNGNTTEGKRGTHVPNVAKTVVLSGRFPAPSEPAPCPPTMTSGNKEKDRGDTGILNVAKSLEPNVLIPPPTVSDIVESKSQTPSTLTNGSTGGFNKKESGVTKSPKPNILPFKPAPLNTDSNSSALANGGVETENEGHTPIPNATKFSTLPPVLSSKPVPKQRTSTLQRSISDPHRISVNQSTKQGPPQTNGCHSETMHHYDVPIRRFHSLSSEDAEEPSSDSGSSEPRLTEKSTSGKEGSLSTSPSDTCVELFSPINHSPSSGVQGQLYAINARLATIANQISKIQTRQSAFEMELQAMKHHEKAPRAMITSDMSPAQVLKVLSAAGLSQYQENFAREAVDGEMFLMLDDEILRTELGVSLKLHRVRLMKMKGSQPQS